MSLTDEVRALNDAFSKAVSNQDVDTLVEFYAADAKVLAPGVPMIEGAAAIKGFLRMMLDEGARLSIRVDCCRWPSRPSSRRWAVSADDGTSRRRTYDRRQKVHRRVEATGRRITATGLRHLQQRRATAVTVGAITSQLLQPTPVQPRHRCADPDVGRQHP